MVFQGNINTIHIPTIFQLFYFSTKSGILKIDIDSIEYDIYFLRGAIVNIKTNFVKSNLLENYLIKNNIPFNDVKELLKMGNNHQEILKKLIVEKKISKEEIQNIIKYQKRELIMEVIGLDLGKFSFEHISAEKQKSEEKYNFDVQKLLMDSLGISEKINTLFKKYNFQDILHANSNCILENYLEYYIIEQLKENKRLIDLLNNSLYSLNKTLEGVDSLFQKGCLTLESSEAIDDEITDFYPDDVAFLMNESDLFKEGYEYYMKGLYNQALKIFEETYKIFPNSPVLGLFITKCYLFNKDMKQALALLKKLIVKFKDNILIHLFLARIFIRLGKLEDAEKYLLHALKKCPKNVAVLWEYANLLFRKGLVDKSIDIYKKILVIQPNNINTLNKLAAIYLKQNDYESAISYWEKVLELDKDNIIAFINLKVIKK